MALPLDGVRVLDLTNVVPTIVACGGPDRKTLYITDSTPGNILAARMPVAGKQMYSHT